MKIFGIGMNKTGTKTLGVCLRGLGYRHTSYDLDLLRMFARGDKEAVLEAARNHESFEDWPWPLLYRELDVEYPGSKFILTVRKNSDVWISSLIRHAERTGPTEARKIVYGHTMPHGYEPEHIRIYEAHNRGVMEYFAERSDKLLAVCWETGSGWPELCEFLGREVPAVPLPHANQSPG